MPPANLAGVRIAAGDAMEGWPKEGEWSPEILNHAARFRLPGKPDQTKFAWLYDHLIRGCELKSDDDAPMGTQAELWPQSVACRAFG
jgi:hypothetical protein